MVGLQYSPTRRLKLGLPSGAKREDGTSILNLLYYFVSSAPFILISNIAGISLALHYSNALGNKASWP